MHKHTLFTMFLLTNMKLMVALKDPSGLVTNIVGAEYGLIDVNELSSHKIV